MSAEGSLRESIEPQPGEAERTDLLGFYDRVRGRITTYCESRGGRAGGRLIEALLLVPDVLLLLIRLFLDREVPKSSRALIGGALAYFLLPTDLAPEIVLGPTGFVEDLVIACTVLAHVLGPELEQRAQGFWSGSGSVLDALSDVSRVSGRLMGSRMTDRVESVVLRRLIKTGSAQT